MPKEIIHDEVGLFDLVISWSPDVHLQVGIQTRDGRSLNEVLRGDENSPPPNYESVWGTFNRPQVNRAIRVLKHARNSVFGVDE